MDFTLEYVCSKMLDNADMRLQMAQFPTVFLEMVVFGNVEGRYWKVLFTFESIAYFRAECEADARASDWFTVLETHVEEVGKNQLTAEEAKCVPSTDEGGPYWRLDLYGDMPLNLLARYFRWEMVELSWAEYDVALDS